MLLTVTPLDNPGPPSPVPPPTPPKPRKDNAKLQRLLRKAAKRSGAQASPTLATKTFRSTLSPVSEADLENNELATPKKTKAPLTIILPPRFQLKGVIHRVPSPYPKQKFTFTVSEQHSLNQYLSLSPVSDSPSPRPLRSSSPSFQFLYPQGGNTDRLSPRLIANSSPRACTPQTIETSPKQPLVSNFQTLTPPAIIVQEINGNDTRPFSPKKEESVNEPIINGFSTPKYEDTKLSNDSSCPKSIPDQQESTDKTNRTTLENESKPVSTLATPEMTDKSEIIHDLSKVVEIPQSMSTDNTRTTSVTQEPTTVNSTDYPDGQSKMTVDVTISSKTTKTTNATSSKDNVTTSEMVPKSEELTVLKSPEKPKPPRKKPGGGWARLVKHLVVEPEEELKFPEPQQAKDKTDKSEEKTDIQGTQSKSSRANKMWDALLYHMATSTKEQEKPGSTAPPALPFFRTRLPLLLNRPRFDARKLKEAASRPLRRVTAFFHRRVTDKAASSATFNRTASGWSIQGEDAKKAIDEDQKQ